MLARFSHSTPTAVSLTLAQTYLDAGRHHKAAENLDVAFILYDQAKVTFRQTADACQVTPPLSQLKSAFAKAQTSEEEVLRQRIAEVYFERAELLEKLGKLDKAQASYSKAQKWGHPGLASQSSILSAGATLPPAALTNQPIIAAQTSGTLHAPAPLSAVNPSSAISADTPSTLAEPVQNAALSPRILEGIQEKNDLVNQLFAETLQTFQSLDLSSVWPSAFLVYAHDNPHYGMADAGTAKFLIDHLVKLGVNLYSDQRPKGLQVPTALSTREDAARVDDILTSQLCLLPTTIGGIQPVDKVIVCGSQVLGHYLQWGEAGKRYQAYCADLKKAYGLAQQNPAQAETEIRQVVNTYSQQAGFHHVLTEMAFLKIRTDYLDQHGIIPISLCVNGYELCVQDFVKATTVRIEDMPRFASQQASGQAVYQQQGRHLVFFKLLERLLAQNGAEALLRTFWTAYADLIKRLNSEASAPKAAEYIRVWGQISQSVQDTLQALRTQVDAHALQTALTRYASLDRLAIQRLSGPPLSMKHCYINLAIVEHKKARKEEERSNEGEAAGQNHFHRLPSFEAIDSNQQKLVPLETLFDPRELSDGKTAIPQRILIRGRAGVGKTTLSKKIVYEYTQKAQWRDRFDWLFWIPLRTLKGKSTCDLSTLFHETYFQSHPNGQALAKALETHISGPAKGKTLFVLDGWDEIAQEWGEHEPMSEFLKQLLNQPAVLITSRPYVDLKQAQAMDLELETVGFSPENVTTYLDNRDMMTALDAQEIKHFIQTNTFIQGLVNVPIQLDALCYSWDEIKRMQKEAPGTMTVTALYQAMMNKLWRKDMLRLGKREGGELLTASHVNALSPSRIERLVKAEHNFLSILAFQGLQRNQIEFSDRDLHALIGQLEAEGVNLPFTLEANLKKLSSLHTDDTQEGQRSYHFMHLTFQEFFAAKHIVQYWETGQEISLWSADAKQWTKAHPEAFVRQHKYNPRYEILWWFVSGLLREEELNRFFEVIDAEPRDLFGASHQRLMMNCLYETSRLPVVGLSSDTRDRLEQDLVQWLLFEIDLRRESTLACQATFPESLLLKCLKEATSIETKKGIVQAFKKRSVLSHSAIHYLIAMRTGGDEHMISIAAELLDEERLLPESGYQALIDLVTDSDEQKRRNAVEVLLKQSSLSASILKTLIRLAMDRDKDARLAVAKVLGQQSSLPESAIQTLIGLATDSDSDIRLAVAKALGEQPSLSELALQALTCLVTDSNNDDIRCAAAKALGRQSSLSESILQILISMTKDERWWVKSAAVKALGQQLSLPASALKALIRLTTSEDENMSYAATEALKQQTSLSEPIFHTLIDLMAGEDEGERSAAADVLAQQPLLSKSTLQALIGLTTNTEKDVRSAAADVLSKQSSLPASALQALTELATDEDESVRCTAARALGNQPLLPESALEVLIGLTTNENWSVSSAAAEALGNQPSLPEPALKALIGLTANENWSVSSAAAKALGKQLSLPDSALEALIGLTTNENWSVRCDTAKILGKQPLLPKPALQALMELVTDEDSSVSRYAIDALCQQTTLSESALQNLIELTRDLGEDVNCALVYALGQRTSLPESILLALVKMTAESEWVVGRDAGDVLYEQPLLPVSVLQALIGLKDGHMFARRDAARVLRKQPSLPESALQALVELTTDSDDWVRKEVAEALGEQSSLPASALQALIELTTDENEHVKVAAANALGQQPLLPASALYALIRLTRSEEIFDGDAATAALDKHRGTLYRLLPTFNKQEIELIYKKYLIKQHFDQSAPFYIQDGTLYFYTAQGLQTVPSGDRDQETEFRQAVQNAQKAAGIPFVPYLNTRDQVEQPDAQNGEEALVVPSISQTQWGPSRTDRGIQTEVFPTAASVNRSSSPHLPARKKILGLTKGFA